MISIERRRSHQIADLDSSSIKTIDHPLGIVFSSLMVKNTDRNNKSIGSKMRIAEHHLIAIRWWCNAVKSTHLFFLYTTDRFKVVKRLTENCRSIEKERKSKISSATKFTNNIYDKRLWFTNNRDLGLEKSFFYCLSFGTNSFCNDICFIRFICSFDTLSNRNDRLMPSIELLFLLLSRSHFFLNELIVRF